MSFLSEAPYARSYGIEILDHSPSSIDLGWLNSGRAPFMVAPNGGGEGGHKGAIQIGSIVAGSARVDADRKTRAQVKISRSPEGDSFLNDYDDDIAINISSGYRQGKPLITKMADGTVTVRWMKVEPREVTRVTLPADETVGIGRSADEAAKEEPTDSTTREVNTLTAEEIKAAEQAATRAAELQRLDDITALGTRFKMEAIATRCALEGKSVDDTRSALLAELNKNQEAEGTTTDADRADGAGKKEEPVITIHQSVQSFTGTRDEAAKKAYRFAQWFVGSVLANERSFEGSRVVSRAKQYCKDHGIRLIRTADRAGQVEGDDTSGGFLVPHEFNNDMIDLREKFGVFRRNVRIVPMATDSRSQPRRKSGLTAYVIGEGKGASESKKGWDRIGLSTKKIGVLTRYSSEIAEDALVSIGDDLASEIAYAFSQFEDTVGFTGNGGVDHARITGVVPRITAVGGPGLVTASGNTWDEFTMADFLKVVGVLPEFAETGNVKWFCSKLFWSTVMVRLALAAGGNNAANIEQGGTKTFLGYGVEVTQTLPKTDANSQIATFFGDLRLAAMLGDRRQTTIRTSEHVHFEEEEIAIAGSERFDINVHDVGSSTAAGPLCALKSASS
jgi:HK97 family phage major capsid protein